MDVIEKESYHSFHIETNIIKPSMCVVIEL